MDLDVIIFAFKEKWIGIDNFLLNFFATFDSTLGLQITVTFGSVLGLQVSTGLQPPTRWEPFVSGTMLRLPEPTKEKVEPTILSTIIIIIFYCGLIVHITDTRAQKVPSYTSAHIAETVFAHDQHWEEQSTLSSPQLYLHSHRHRKCITIE